MKHFTVIGHPISHSKSPEIHLAFAKQFGIALSYEKQLSELDHFSKTATAFFKQGTGANVTVPFKEDALRFADKLSDDAKIAVAVNTLSKKSGCIWGDNTDGIGLVTDITINHHTQLSGKNILIIGAGGAASGIILPIARENPKKITIVNRTYSKALTLANRVASYITLAITQDNSQPINIEAKIFNELHSPYDIIINATSASLSGEQLNVNAAVFSHRSFSYDMMYANNPSLFMQLATYHKATAVDGLGMLVEQAAKSFEIWHGVMPQTATVIKDIRYTIA